MQMQPFYSLTALPKRCVSEATAALGLYLGSLALSIPYFNHYELCNGFDTPALGTSSDWRRCSVCCVLALCCRRTRL